MADMPTHQCTHTCLDLHSHAHSSVHTHSCTPTGAPMESHPCAQSHMYTICYMSQNMHPCRELTHTHIISPSCPHTRGHTSHPCKLVCLPLCNYTGESSVQIPLRCRSHAGDRGDDHSCKHSLPQESHVPLPTCRLRHTHRHTQRLPWLSSTVPTAAMRSEASGNLELPGCPWDTESTLPTPTPAPKLGSLGPW